MKLPGIPSLTALDEGLKRVIEPIKTILEVREGRRQHASQLDRYATLQDLVTMGLLDGSDPGLFGELPTGSPDSRLRAIERTLGMSGYTAYSDYLYSGLSFASKGAGTPDLATFVGNIKMPAFSNSATTEGFFSIHLLHGLKPGGQLTLHFHWAHNNVSPSGNVKFNVEYTVARGYGAGVFASSPTTTSIVVPAGAERAHQITDDDAIVLAASDELEPDAILIGRFWRDPADAADTFNDEVFVLHTDVHYSMQGVGTPERNRAFTGFAP